MSLLRQEWLSAREHSTHPAAQGLAVRGAARAERRGAVVREVAKAAAVRVAAVMGAVVKAAALEAGLGAEG